jgi:CspA family cold shock protein
MAQGTVKWFSNESDYGYVCPDDGGQDIHVRRRHMPDDALECLEKGDRVAYEMPQDGRGLWATGVSKEEQRCYSWQDVYLEQHESKETRHEYYVRLEEGEEA